MKKTTTVHWDYTGPWNYYRRQWRTGLLTWLVLAWEVGLLVATHSWIYAACVVVLVLAACIPLLTWHRSVKPHIAMRARWVEQDRAAIARLDEQLASPDLLPEVRPLLESIRQHHQESLARWSAPTTTIPRRTKDIRRQLDRLVEQLGGQRR